MTQMVGSPLPLGETRVLIQPQLAEWFIRCMSSASICVRSISRMIWYLFSMTLRATWRCGHQLLSWSALHCAGERMFLLCAWVWKMELHPLSLCCTPLYSLLSAGVPNSTVSLNTTPPSSVGSLWGNCILISFLYDGLKNFVLIAHFFLKPSWMYSCLIYKTLTISLFPVLPDSITLPRHDLLVQKGSILTFLGCHETPPWGR